MESKCTAILDNNIVISNLPINYDSFQIISKIDIDFKIVVGLEDKEFSKFFKTNWKNERKASKLSDIRKLYHIEKIQNHSEAFWSILKKFVCLYRYLPIFHSHVNEP